MGISLATITVSALYRAVAVAFSTRTVKTKIKIQNLYVESQIELKNEPNTHKFCALSAIKKRNNSHRSQRSGPYQKT